MHKHLFALWPVLWAALAIGCSRETPASTGPGQGYEERDVWPPGGYDELMRGWNLYEGFVVAVDRDKRVYGDDGSGSVTWMETGNVHLRVAQTLWGKGLAEIVRTYGCYRDDIPAPSEPLASDWGGGPWDYKPPHVGQHLLVLLDSCIPSALCPDAVGEVHFIWRLHEKDPLVDGFRDAAAYLRSMDPSERREYFRRLCQSDLKNIRQFARDASFGAIKAPKNEGDRTPVDPATWSDLIVDYFRFTDPKRLKEDCPTRITGGFLRLHEPGYASKSSPEVRQLFEDWYLGELGRGGDQERQGAAIRDLTRIVQGLGSSKTLALLFSEAGRRNLSERVDQACDSLVPEVRDQARKLQQLLRQP